MEKFYMPQLDEWFDIDLDELQTIGNELLYLNKLWQLGCTLIVDEKGKQKEVRSLLAGFPFVYEELVVHLALLEDGWAPLTLSKAEGLNCMCYVDTLGKPVTPLFKKLGRVEAVHDVNGITFYWGKIKVVYSSPLPF